MAFRLRRFDSARRFTCSSYQAEAAAKRIGGLSYSYAVRGDTQPVAEIVPAVEQPRPLQALPGC